MLHRPVVGAVLISLLIALMAAAPVFVLTISGGAWLELPPTAYRVLVLLLPLGVGMATLGLVFRRCLAVEQRICATEASHRDRPPARRLGLAEGVRDASSSRGPQPLPIPAAEER